MNISVFQLLYDIIRLTALHPTGVQRDTGKQITNSSSTHILLASIIIVLQSEVCERKGEDHQLSSGEGLHWKIVEPR